ncbi:hypothetical protein BG004_000231 [Podila humilis]|nr:hypothetical protein BG004_000231 [Podila humilis]
MAHSDGDVPVIADLNVPESPKDSAKYETTAKPKPPLTDEERANMKKPKVLIVGAGIGGLFLGQLLHKGGVPFEIFERAKEVKPLGSALSLGGTVSTVFKQLGIFDDFVELGKFNHGWTSYFEDKPNSSIDTRCAAAMAGANEYIVPRPEFYDLLLRQIPKENIHMNKKVLSFLQNDLGTMIRCNDGTSYHGDILVGADGAYSAVRQHLFTVLKERNQLPKSDDVPLPFDTIALFTTKKDTICWMVVQYLNSDTSKGNDSFRNSEWGAEAAESMCKMVSHLKVRYGKDQNMTMGGLIDLTPKHLISKVMLEEIVFETWYGGRTVLLGDACHKVSPNGGQGAVSAIHDAVALANWICSLETKTMGDFRRIFAEYRSERRPVAVHAYNASKALKKGGERNITGTFFRFVFRHMPGWLLKSILRKSVLVRPQVGFLPVVDDKGTVPRLPQPSLEKTLPIFLARMEKQKADDQARTNQESDAVAV